MWFFDDPFLREIQGWSHIFFAEPPPLYIFLAVFQIAWGLGKRCGSLGKIHPLPPDIFSLTGGLYFRAQHKVVLLGLIKIT